MQTRLLGATGVRLGALGFGCMGLVGWYGSRNDAEARATVLAALDRGINHLDTATSYQKGENEKFVGATIRGRRAGLFLASKYGIERNAEGTMVIDNRPAAVKAAVEASLQRLGVDCLDLYYLHRIDTTVPIEESVGALADLIKAGKIRYAGLSECSVQTLRRACAVHPIAAVQTEYSLWSRDPENGMLAACRELGAAFVAYAPLGRGFLAGNFRTLADLPADDNRRNHPRFQEANVAHNARIVEGIRALAERKNATPARIAIAWVLAQDPNIHPIVGMKTRTHLDDNLAAVDLTLSHEEREKLRAIATAHGERHPPAMMKTVDR